MPETMVVWMEVSFNITYLIVVWALVIAMARQRSVVWPEDQHVAGLVLKAFMLLALGDTGHVGFRVLAYARGNMTAQSGLVGLGALATAITVTLFYVLMLAVWRSRFHREYGPLGHFLLACALVRLALMALPANRWGSTVPPQPWSTVRNLPLLVQGLGVAYLLLRDARPNGDRPFWWIGIMILISYACYLPVILLVQRIPLIGMLMIPKTMAYVAVGLLAYFELYHAPMSQSAPGRQVH